jgi:hypothetical protein
MTKDNIPPFYVGQKVVALATSLKSMNKQVIKGKIYTVGEMVFCCGQWLVGCKELLIKTKEPFFLCHISTKNKYCGGPASKFAPLHENFQSISLSKILEEETKLIGVN